MIVTGSCKSILEEMQPVATTSVPIAMVLPTGPGRSIGAESGGGCFIGLCLLKTCLKTCTIWLVQTSREDLWLANQTTLGVASVVASRREVKPHSDNVDQIPSITVSSYHRPRKNLFCTCRTIRIAFTILKMTTVACINAGVGRSRAWLLDVGSMYQTDGSLLSQQFRFHHQTVGTRALANSWKLTLCRACFSGSTGSIQ
jgi:hypothetical protein